MVLHWFPKQLKIQRRLFFQTIVETEHQDFENLSISPDYLLKIPMVILLMEEIVLTTWDV